MIHFDQAWKLALEEAFESFTELLFPEAYRGIDWSRGYERLDKELRELTGPADTGGRVVDFLVKVWKQTGEEEWVLVHVEVQSQPDADFPLRMFTYHYRAFDLHHRPVASLAVLADERSSWRPSEFAYNLWGCQTQFKFPTAKLLDWKSRRAELEAMANPFATVVLAHLDTIESRRNPDLMGRSKFELLRRLYDRGMSRDQIRFLFRVIDAMMVLPDQLERQFRARFSRFEQERNMPYVTSFERLAREEGLEQGLEKGIEQGIEQGERRGVRLGLLRGIERFVTMRFPDSATPLLTQIREIHDARLLESILDAALTAQSADELRKLWSSPA